MKTKWNLYIWLIASVFVLASCEEEAIDPLAGMYTPPDLYDFTVLDLQDRVKDGSLYVFSIDLSDGGSNTLSMKLVASDYMLPASDFTASDSLARKTYLTGENGSTCNGIAITKGTLSIAVEDSTNYTMEGVLYLADESVAKISASVTMIFEPDPYVPAYTYVKTITAPATYGGWTVTEIPGSQLNTIKIVDEFNDTVAVFELITAEDATSLAGDYPVLDGSNTNMAIGDANNGYYLDWSWYGGTGVQTGGSYYVQGGEAQYIRTGSTIHVEDDGGTLKITGDDLYLQDITTGASFANKSETGSCAFEDVTQAYKMTNLFQASATDWSAYGGNWGVTLKISTDGITATYNEATWGYDYTGSGHFISLDFNRDAGTLVEGSYNIVENGTATVGDCTAGYDSGYGSNWGCVWGTVTDGAASDITINEGVVEVTLDGEIYTIAVDAITSEGRLVASYSGPIIFAK